MDFIKKSFFLKLILPISFLLVIGMVIIALYIPYAIKQAAIKDAILSAKEDVSKYKALRKYYTINVIKKVIKTGVIKPSFDHKNRKNSIPLPATLIHDLSSMMKDKGTKLTLYSAYPFPNRNSRILDTFQKQSWQGLSQKPDEVFTKTVHNEKGTFVRVAIADHMVNAACVNCHNNRADTPKNDWKLGDVRGVLEITKNIDSQIQNGFTVSFKIILVLLGVIFSALTLFFFQFKHATNKLKSMSEIFKSASEGDLRHRHNVTGQDEIAELGDSFNTFLVNTRDVVVNISDASDQLSSAANELSASSTQTQASMLEQQSQTEQVATAMNEMYATAQEVARNAEHASSSTSEADEQQTKGRLIVDEAVRAMDDLVVEVEKVNTIINSLEQDSNSIGAVLDVIRGIAEQTNLLALNAAIEAARAGEQGRGFAVVADEVRCLAGRTQESTQEIQSMIERLQSGVSNAVSAMGKSHEYTSASVQKTRVIGDSLGAIAKTIEDLSNMNTQIATASEEQTQVAGEVDSNLMRIRDMTNQSSDSADNITRESNTLIDLSSHLKRLVGKFKI